MLDGSRLSPRLMKDVVLVHPEGTDQYFAYRSATGVRYELNEVAYEMLHRLDGKRDLATLSAEIEAEFESAADVQRDIETLLAGLLNEGLLQTGGD